MQIVPLNIETVPFWNMSFDGSFGKKGSGFGVWVRNIENNHA